MSDYISRQASIDDLHTQLMYRMGSDGMKRRLDDWVKTLPSADVVQVVHGRWVKEHWHGETTRMCSVCHITQTVTVYKGEVKFNYCPYCRAKMDGGDEHG